ncbi:uncharacterized protein LOC120149703 [Hibiscus syriacus]|uniref:uncharacterized protein LOC120149703 n=1 Tax=Hibiscus syriacus TaxID=106335 RepID=UPI001921E722|nr:uncharacterized protein LOC120149703 [Hibiscus syriacus]
MDIENDYFLVWLRTRSDFLTALSDGPWTIFRYYLTVEPWSPNFTSSQLFPSRIVAWIRLPGLPVTLYKRSLIVEIGECIGKVVKIDYQTETGHQGRFARMAVNVDLKKPLTSKLLINGRIQIVEYESLPTICFSCGQYGHVNDIFPDKIIVDQHDSNDPKDQISEPQLSTANQSSEPFGPWMVIERRQQKSNKKPPADKRQNLENNGSHFNPLYESADDVTIVSFENQATYTNKVTHTQNTAQTPHAHHASHGPNVSHASHATNSLSSANHAQSSKSNSSSQHTAKNKMVTLSRKPLIIPKITARSSKGSPSQSSNQPRQSNVEPRVTILDRSKHSTIVLAENTNPNIIDDVNLQVMHRTTQHKSIPREPPDTNQLHSSEAFSKRPEADPTSPAQRDDATQNICIDSQTVPILE